MTLLTPAVLNCSALESLKEKDQKFHKKYVFQFALLQGFWGVIVFVLLWAFYCIPFATKLKTEGDKVLLNANFSSMTIENGKATVDIKPAIWVYTISDSPSEQKMVAIDSVGTMNKYYWDDRVEKGSVKKIDGIGVMKEYLYVKKGTWIKKIPYSQFSKNKVVMTKGDISDSLERMTSKKMMITMLLCMIPVVFLTVFLVGGLTHILFGRITGELLAMLSNSYKVNLESSLKMSNGLYVVWAYLVGLSMVSQKIVFLTYGNMSPYFIAFDILAYFGVFFVGYLCFKGSVSPSKVVKKNNDSR